MTGRQKFGYVYRSQINNDVGTVQYVRSPYNPFNDTVSSIPQKGEGMGDMIKSMYDQAQPKMMGQGLALPGQGLKLPGQGLKLPGQGLKLPGQGMGVMPGGNIILPGEGQPGAGLLPGDALKMKLLRTIARKQKGRGKKLSMSKTLPKMKNYKMMGAGILLPGGGRGKIMDFVMKKIVPSLMKAVKIPTNSKTMKAVGGLVSKALDKAKSGKLSQIVSHLTKTLLPLLTALKMKHMGGSGTKTISGVLKDNRSSLAISLGKGLYNAFKWYINRVSKQKGQAPIFGSGLSGNGKFKDFWKKFKTGFKKVLKPGVKVLGGVATALGVPELGIPLSIAGQLIK